MLYCTLLAWYRLYMGRLAMSACALLTQATNTRHFSFEHNMYFSYASSFIISCLRWFSWRIAFCSIFFFCCYRSRCQKQLSQRTRARASQNWITLRCELKTTGAVCVRNNRIKKKQRCERYGIWNASTFSYKTTNEPTARYNLAVLIMCPIIFTHANVSYKLPRVFCQIFNRRSLVMGNQNAIFYQAITTNRTSEFSICASSARRQVDIACTVIQLYSRLPSARLVW